ncbi:hypothetical protein MLD38_009074 [Melastoma candidum]|uniref:Uncharacterized protein n=1 Tax=Melastoma candidum TaxID=119954 RepID=A0ACB9RXP2_9MYRT|nr:hypothetical protein MLD38_009074 [Melastoma candidum]
MASWVIQVKYSKDGVQMVHPRPSPPSKRPTATFSLNDHVDILTEILTRLDGRSLGVAACVCRAWRALSRSDAVWERLCFRHVSPPPPSGTRHVVLALGGYRKLYMMCVRPLLLGGGGRGRGEGLAMWSREGLQLSLSLFCVDYYERVGTASSPAFLCNCKPVNV